MSRTKNSPVSGERPNSISASGWLRAELDGIAEKVLQSDPQQPGVGVGFKSGFDAEDQIPVRIFGAQVAGHIGRKLGDIDLFAGKFGARDARELKQRIDKLAHLLHPGADAPNVVVALRIHGVREVLFKGQTESVNGAERRAQVVRDRIAEGLQLAIAGRQLGGA